MQTDAPNPTESSSKPSLPAWFWMISSIALFWYLMDMSSFFMRVFATDYVINNMPENQQHLYQNMPLWVNIVFAAEVFGGLFGSLGLLFRKKWALGFFIISIFGILAQTSHIYFFSDAISTMGNPAIVMPLIAIVIGAGLIIIAKFATSKDWLQ